MQHGAEKTRDPGAVGAGAEASEILPPGEVFARVDAFLKTEIEARALDFALSRGWLDSPGVDLVTLKALAQSQRVPAQAVDFVLDVLAAGNVLHHETAAIAQTPAFLRALSVRDLLEAKLWFANLVAPDVHLLFEQLMTDIPAFMAGAKVFELFRYDLCLEVTEDNLAAAARWVGYTTTLTRYESAGCRAALRRLAPRRMLDIGGNSGEFARNAVAAAPGLFADILDLPVVCELGRRHLAGSPQAGRVGFISADLRIDEIPSGYDLIVFKSMLHDWPDDHAWAFIEKAWRALEPGGSLMIFERGQISARTTPMPYSMVANLVFLPFFRDAQLYRDWLETLGFLECSYETIMLEMPFHLITARKPL